MLLYIVLLGCVIVGVALLIPVAVIRAAEVVNIGEASAASAKIFGASEVDVESRLTGGGSGVFANIVEAAVVEMQRLD